MLFSGQLPVFRNAADVLYCDTTWSMRDLHGGQLACRSQSLKDEGTRGKVAFVRATFVDVEAATCVVVSTARAYRHFSICRVRPKDRKVTEAEMEVKGRMMASTGNEFTCST
jgi:hypothetical protein